MITRGFKFKYVIETGLLHPDDANKFEDAVERLVQEHNEKILRLNLRMVKY